MIRKFDTNGLGLMPFPIEFGEELSTIEIVAGLVKKINDVIYTLNNINASNEKLVKDELSKMSEQLYSDLDDLEIAINTLTDSKINISSNLSKKYVDDKVTELNMSLLNLENNLTDSFKNADKILEKKLFDTLNVEISKIEKIFNEINQHFKEYSLVQCPVCLEFTTHQHALFHIFNALAVDRLTVDEYTNYEVTYNEYETLNVSVSEYDCNSRMIIANLKEE